MVDWKKKKRKDKTKLLEDLGSNFVTFLMVGCVFCLIMLSALQEEYEYKSNVSEEVNISIGIASTAIENAFLTVFDKISNVGSGSSWRLPLLAIGIIIFTIAFIILPIIDFIRDWKDLNVKYDSSITDIWLEDLEEKKDV